MKQQQIFTNWRNKKRINIRGLFVFFLSILTVGVTIYQAFIVSRQTDIMDSQKEISEKQSRLLSNQIESSTNPFVDIQQYTYENWDSVIIDNKGNYPIRNIHIRQLYFAYAENHGWTVVAPNWFLPPDRDSINSKKRWSYDVNKLVSFYNKPPISNNYRATKEYLVVLVSFERDFDGKSYMAILPYILFRWNKTVDPNESADLFVDGPTSSLSGPLSSICNTGVELTLEYFKRRPSFKNFEVYNSNYLLGNTPFGCLGEIKWVN